MARRPGAFARLLHHFHTHPRGRLHEFLFFAGIGALFLGGAWLGNATEKVSQPIAWLLAIVGVCFVVFALLPQKRAAPPPPPPKGRRGEIAKQVQASKAEKRKGPPPPIK